MHRGEIAYFDLGSPPGGQGHEQSGRRPAIIISNDANDSRNPMVLVIPLTSRAAASRFPHTVTINSSQNNGLVYNSIALVFQLRAIDKNRLVNVIGRLDPPELRTIETQIRSLLNL